MATAEWKHNWTSTTHSRSPAVATSEGQNVELILQALGESAKRGLHSMVDVPQKTYADDLHFAMSAVIGPVVCLFGMLGNLLSVITWQRPKMSSSTGTYLTGQGVANFFLLLLFLLCDSLQYWSPELKHSFIYGAFFAYFGFPMFFLTIMLSIWFTVALTVDRYIMVCWVTKAKSLCNESRANVGLILISVNSFMINIPHFASFTPIYQDEDNNNTHNYINNNNNTNDRQPKVAYTETEFGMSAGGMFYEFWIHCMVLTVIPWMSVLYMNVMIIVKINEANTRMADKKTSQSLMKSKKSENQITRLLLAVTFTFLFFLGFNCITHCLWTKKLPGANPVMVSASFSFGKTGILFNSSLNFVLYCLTGRRFRTELLKMLGLVSKDLMMSSIVDTPTSNTSSTSMAASVTRTLTKDT
ncbi:unnamed protein product [Candidula unifasciata]|uniref:G-protein coupled receptors family 1 profile domain-containing protein n=1 Tax=Candidula unifasciata TaxID=100452 RepID=A0A8S3YM12_9EUPU|nr:unnamed protein product [Candidula unifasciata]